MKLVCFKLLMQTARQCGNCDTECPISQCVCCPGPPEVGGKPVIPGLNLCSHFCKEDNFGNEYCGDGPFFANGIDCRKCTIPKPTLVPSKHHIVSKF